MFKNMFSNAGGKLMSLSKLIFAVFAVIGIIIGISLGRTVGYWINGVLGFITFLIVSGVGAVMAWLITIMVYAFGELCANVKTIREGMGYSAPQEAQMNIGQMASQFGNTVSNAASNVSSRFGGAQKHQQHNRPQSTAASGWICPNCGQPNGPENAFCTGCGCSKN